MSYYVRQVYEPIYDYFGGNEFLLAVVGSNLMHGIALWGTNSIFLYTDFTGKPTWMKRFKIQPDKNFPAPRDKLLNCLKVVMFNWLIWNTVVFAALYYLWKAVGSSFKPEEIPDTFTIVFHVLITNLLDEIIFYWTHRIMHIPRIYKVIHKQHHEWPAPIGIVVYYAGIIEHAIVNIFAISIGTVVMRSHIVVTWIWYLLGISIASIGHSGYHLPFSVSPRFHDFHHAKFNTNYGNAGWMDGLNQTDILFNKSDEYDRHFILTGLKSAGELFPGKQQQQQQNGTKYSANSHSDDNKNK